MKKINDEIREEAEAEVMEIYENTLDDKEWEEEVGNLVDKKIANGELTAKIEAEAQNMMLEDIKGKAQEEFEKTKDEKISSENTDNYKDYQYNSPIEAYATFLQNNIKKYDINKNGQPKYFLQNIKDIICQTTYGGDTTYWGFELREDISDIPFEEFENKNEFKKSEFSFGKKRNAEKYFVKVNNETKVFNSKNEVNDAIYENSLIPTCENVEEFKTKEIPYAYNKANKNLILAYTIKKLDEKKILEYLKKWLLMLCGNENGSETEETIYEKSIEKFYPNINRFGSIESMKNKAEGGDYSYNGIYGIIRLYITRKLGEGVRCESIQEFIDTYSLVNQINSKEKDNNEIKWYGQGIVDLEAYIEKEITALLKRGKNNLGYWVDSSKREQKLKNFKNYNDRESFGLNSTFEHVKQHKPNATFSFGEVYVALYAHFAKDELEKTIAERHEKRLLSCVKAQLRKTYTETSPEAKDFNEKRDEYIKIKLEEVKNRIEYLKKIFAADDGDNKITAIEVMGAASNQGSTSNNITLFNFAL